MFPSNLPHREPRQKPEKDERLIANVKKVEKIVHKLKKTHVAAFSDEQLLADYGISVQKLDVVNGDPCSRGQAYIKPISPETVIEWLKKYAPEESEDLESYEIDFPNLDITGQSPGFNFNEALQLSNLLLNRVKYSNNSNMGVMVRKESGWDETELPNDCINYYYPPHSDWEAREPFHQVHPSQKELDFDCVTESHPKLPHMQCWLADELPINDDLCLSPAELITTLVLAIAKIRTPKYRQASVIPITVFSCCGRKLRIVQGAINFHNLDLDFRCSVVADFSVGGVRSNSRNAKMVAQILGWVLGSPIGQIFPGKSQ